MSLYYIKPFQSYKVVNLFTCQVFILTPLVVPLNVALFTCTLDTLASELPSPKLPML